MVLGDSKNGTIGVLGDSKNGTIGVLGIPNREQQGAKRGIPKREQATKKGILKRNNSDQGRSDNSLLRASKGLDGSMIGTSDSEQISDPSPDEGSLFLTENGMDDGNTVALLYVPGAGFPYDFS